MKDEFIFLTKRIDSYTQFPDAMKELFRPYEGKIHAFHHDVAYEGSRLVITVTLQLKKK